MKFFVATSSTINLNRSLQFEVQTSTNQEQVVGDDDFVIFLLPSGESRLGLKLTNSSSAVIEEILTFADDLGELYKWAKSDLDWNATLDLSSEEAQCFRTVVVESTSGAPHEPKDRRQRALDPKMIVIRSGGTNPLPLPSSAPSIPEGAINV